VKHLPPNMVQKQRRFHIISVSPV